MPPPYEPPQFDAQDRKLFDTFVPFDRWTRRADKHIDFLEVLRELESADAQKNTA